MRTLDWITSKKHPGAVFLKVSGTREEFIAKFYPGHDHDARLFKDTWERMHEREDLIETYSERG